MWWAIAAGRVGEQRTAGTAGGLAERSLIAESSWLIDQPSHNPSASAQRSAARKRSNHHVRNDTTRGRRREEQTGGAVRFGSASTRRERTDAHARGDNESDVDWLIRCTARAGLPRRLLSLPALSADAAALPLTLPCDCCSHSLTHSPSARSARPAAVCLAPRPLPVSSPSAAAAALHCTAAVTMPPARRSSSRANQDAADTNNGKPQSKANSKQQDLSPLTTAAQSPESPSEVSRRTAAALRPASTASDMAAVAHSRRFTVWVARISILAVCSLHAGARLRVPLSSARLCTLPCPATRPRPLSRICLPFPLRPPSPPPTSGRRTRTVAASNFCAPSLWPTG